MPLSRKESFRQATITNSTKTLQEKIEDTVRSQLLDVLTLDDCQTIADALKTTNCDESCSNIRQEDLIPVFDEMNLRIGGHIIRQRLTDMGVPLNSVGYIDLQKIAQLYLDIKSEMENESSKMDFRHKLKSKTIVRTTDKLRDTTKVIGALSSNSNDYPEEGSAVPPSRASNSRTKTTTLLLPSVKESEEVQETLPASEMENEGFLSHHTYSEAERYAFSNWINEKLKDDKFVSDKLPIDPNSDTDLFEKCTDGIVLIRMIKVIKASLINDRVINTFINGDPQSRMVIESIIDSKNVFKKIENLNLALNTAAAIGCNTVNQDASSILYDVNPYLILGLLWQIIRAGLFVEIELEKSSEIFDKLKLLMTEGEDLGKLYSLNPEEILLRWVNYHLEANQEYDGKPITNFGSDIKDSHAYQCLLQQLQEQEKIHNEEFSARNVILAPNYRTELNVINRAVHVLKMADNLGAKAFVTAKDIVSGNQKLNTAFVANLFNKKMHMYKPDLADDLENAGENANQNVENEDGENDEDFKEGDEEKIYKNWINSLDLKSTCNYLYTDLRDGIIILKLEDRICPGIVAWKKKVNFPPFRSQLAGGENCCYALDLAEDDRIGVKLAGCTRGHDINMGTPRVLTLGLVWQLMRSYTTSLLFSLSEETDQKTKKKLALEDKEVIAWINSKIPNEVEKIKSFKDSKLKYGLAISYCLQSIAKLQSNSETVVDVSGIYKSSSYEELLENASYLIGTARKLGALVYTLPEHIVNVDSKMMLCLFITLMVLERQEILNSREEVELQKQFAKMMEVDQSDPLIASKEAVKQNPAVGIRRRDTFRSRVSSGSSLKPNISAKPKVLPKCVQAIRENVEEKRAETPEQESAERKPSEQSSILVVEDQNASQSKKSSKSSRSSSSKSEKGSGFFSKMKDAVFGSAKCKKKSRSSSSSSSSSSSRSSSSDDEELETKHEEVFEQPTQNQDQQNQKSSTEETNQVQVTKVSETTYHGKSGSESLTATQENVEDSLSLNLESNQPQVSICRSELGCFDSGRIAPQNSMKTDAPCGQFAQNSESNSMMTNTSTMTTTSSSNSTMTSQQAHSLNFGTEISDVSTTFDKNVEKTANGTLTTVTRTTVITCTGQVQQGESKEMKIEEMKSKCSEYMEANRSSLTGGVNANHAASESRVSSFSESREEEVNSVASMESSNCQEPCSHCPYYLTGASKLKPVKEDD